MRSLAPLDFLALEPLLVARLREQMPAHVHVLARRELSEIVEPSQPTPAVHVLYRGYRPSRARTGMYEELDLLWLTVVSVLNATDVTAGAGARADAGALLGAVVQSLGPWVPPLAGYESMALDDAPMAGYRAGHAYFPLGWRVPVRMRVAPNSRSM